MKLLKGLLLGSMASLAVAALAPAARRRLPEHQARRSNMSAFATPMAPDFSISPAPKPVCGSRLGARRVPRLRSELQHCRPSFYGNGIAPAHSGLTPAIPSAWLHPSVSQYTNARSRDATSFNALGRASSTPGRSHPMALCGLSCGLIPIMDRAAIRDG